MPAPDVQIRTAIALESIAASLDRLEAARLNAIANRLERGAAALERLAACAERVVGRGSPWPAQKVNVHDSADTARAGEIGDALIAVQREEEGRRRA